MNKTVVMADNASVYGSWYSLLYGGIDFEMPGNGGQECLDYLPPWHRLWESVLTLAISFLEIYVSWKFISLSEKPFAAQQNGTPPVNGTIAKARKEKRPILQMPLLIFLCIVFGIEIGYKLATRSLIFLLNPCHVLTFLQIYLLTVDNSKTSKVARTLFRFHLHALSGALLAIVLPVTNTRFLPFEPESYWVHHILLYLTPVYLIYCGNNFVPEPLTDIWWPLLSIGVDFAYHYVVLQTLGILTLVNLNNMLCPALSDPFEGTYYRMWALGHQHLLLLIHGKLYQILAFAVITILTWISAAFYTFWWTLRSSMSGKNRSLHKID